MLLELHESWSWVVIFANAVAGLWALAAHRWTPLRTRALWWFVVIAELTIFVQVGLGVGMVAGQGLAVPKFHMFYGFVAIIAVGLIYSYRQQMEKHKSSAAFSSWVSASAPCSWPPGSEAPSRQAGHRSRPEIWTPGDLDAMRAGPEPRPRSVHDVCTVQAVRRFSSSRSSSRSSAGSCEPIES